MKQVGSLLNVRRGEKPVTRLLGQVTKESTRRNNLRLNSEVRSVTNTAGLVPTGDYFENVRTSQDTGQYKVVEPGWFVYNPSRINIGSLSWSQESHPVIVSPMYVVFTVDSTQLLPEYLYLYLGSNECRRLIESRTEEGARFRLPYKSLATIPIPLPPLEVQCEIVRILDTFLELEAELNAELEARRVQCAHYRNALLTFGDDIPWSTLGNIAYYVNGKAHERLAETDGDIPMVTARFISRGGEANRFVHIENVLTPASKGDTALVLSDLPNGRALARTFFIDRDNGYAINQRVARLRVKDPEEVDPKFLYHFMDRNPGLLIHDNGIDQTHLSKSQVTGLPFPLPSLQEQCRISRALDMFKSLTNDLSIGLPAELNARRQQYEYYRDRLLTFQELTA